MEVTYLDKDTYHIVNNLNNNSFEVDKSVANIISTLNIKGYTTKYSCSGHYLDNNIKIEKIPKTESTKEELLDFLNENNLKFIKEDNKRHGLFFIFIIQQ